MTELSNLASSTLVAIYNRLVPDASTDEMPLAAVKKFSDKATAVKRVTSILESVNKTREQDGMLPFVVADDGSVIELPESGSTTTSEASTEVIELRDSGALDAKVEENFEEFVKEGNETSATTTLAEPAPVKDPAPTEKAPDDAKTTAAKEAAKVRRKEVRTQPSPKHVGGRPALVGETDIIHLDHVGDNPKRAEAARRFAKYRDGMTIQQYIDAVGNRRQALRDVAWDMRQKWVRVTGAPKGKKAESVAEVAPEQVEAASEQVETPAEALPETSVDQAA